MCLDLGKQTMTKDEALKDAIEALLLANHRSIWGDEYNSEIESCRKALEQPAQDYVLICKRCGDDLGIVMDDM